MSFGTQLAPGRPPCVTLKMTCLPMPSCPGSRRGAPSPLPLSPHVGGEGNMEVSLSLDVGGEGNIKVSLSPGAGERGRGEGVDEQAASEGKSAHLPTASESVSKTLEMSMPSMFPGKWCDPPIRKREKDPFPGPFSRDVPNWRSTRE